jgi:hypothetical protein
VRRAHHGSLAQWSLLAALALACAPGETPARPDSAGTPGSPAPSPPDSAAAAATAAPLIISYGKARPVDEAPRDPTFVAFRDTLLRIVARRDTTALFALLAPGIKSSFGENDDVDGFRRVWRPEAPDTELWRVLDDVLRHGGRFAGPDAFYAPWTFNALPDSLDAFEHLIVRDSNVVVRARPDASSTALAVLSYDIVRAGPYSDDPEWRMVALANGDTAYVAARSIRSPVDHRAGFERRDGRWLLAFFLAGD